MLRLTISGKVRTELCDDDAVAVVAVKDVAAEARYFRVKSHRRVQIVYDPKAILGLGAVGGGRGEGDGQGQEDKGADDEDEAHAAIEDIRKCV